jgi:GT2 family glycosyltransferase
MSKTAVVILNWNGLEFLKNFLDNTITKSSHSDSVIYIADNGSTDGSVEWIMQNHKDVKLILHSKNHGFAGGYNLALSQIEAKYFLLLNSDIEVSKDWLNPLVEHMDNNDNVAACQPKIMSFHNKEYFEYAGAAGGYIDKYGYPFCRGRIFDYTEKDYGQYNDQKDIFWSSGACMIVRAEAWEKCGGFDDSFFAHMEEIDLCWRFQKAGYVIRYIPDSTVYHVGGGTLKYESPFKTYLNFRNNLFLLYKNLPEKNFRKILFIRKLLDGIAAAKYLFAGKAANFSSVLEAHISYYKSISDLKNKRKIITDTLLNNESLAVMNKSIVMEFYLKRNKTFNKLGLEKK